MKDGIRPTVRFTGDFRTVALTFDDGPNPAMTPRFLELLARHRVRATFFLIGRHVRANPGLAREIVAAGHAVGNHTDTHVKLLFSSAETTRTELLRCSDAIEGACGRRPRCLRPPHGLRRPNLKRIAQAQGLEWLVMWSRMAWDWKLRHYTEIVRYLTRVRGGDVVLMHDGDPEPGADRMHTLLALTELVPRWIDAGLRFKTIDELRPATLSPGVTVG